MNHDRHEWHKELAQTRGWTATCVQCGLTKDSNGGLYWQPLTNEWFEKSPACMPPRHTDSGDASNG